MASNYSRYSSVRVYRRYCFGAIFSGILSLGVAGIFAAFLLLPLFQFNVEGGASTNVTGLQFSMYALRNYVKVNLPDLFKYDGLLTFNDYMSGYTGTNQLLGVIKNIYPYIELALFALFALAVIFALVTAILGLVFIFAGRLSNPKSPLGFTRASLIFAIIFGGLFYLYTFFAQQMINDVVTANPGTAKAAFVFNFLALILLGGLLVLTIILHITYSAAFKNKVFAGRKKKGEEGAQVEVNNNPQYGQPMAYQQMNNQAPYGGNMMNEPAPMKPAGQMGPMTLPTDLREIGDHAYAKCLTLKVANIPQGVSDIGPSAFSNCLNLETVTIPISVKEIGYNCFFNTPNLKKIVYQGRVADWKKIVKGSNWLTHSGVNIVTAVDGKIAVKTQ